MLSLWDLLDADLPLPAVHPDRADPGHSEDAVQHAEAVGREVVLALGQHWNWADQKRKKKLRHCRW